MENVRLVNLTPHPINMYDENKKFLFVIEPCYPSARVEKYDRHEDTFIYKGKKIPLASIQYGITTGLRDPIPNTIYIVSIMVKNANPNRPDLVTVGGMIRDRHTKKVIGSQYFIW